VRYLVFQFQRELLQLLFLEAITLRHLSLQLSLPTNITQRARGEREEIKREERGEDDCWLADLLFLESSGPPLLLPDLSLRALQLQIQSRDLWSSGGEFRLEREDLSFLWGKDKRERGEVRRGQDKRKGWADLLLDRRGGQGGCQCFFSLSLSLLSNLDIPLSLRLSLITGDRPRDEESEGKRSEDRLGLAREGCWDLLTSLSKCRSKSSVNSFFLRSLAQSRAVFPFWEINERVEATAGLTLFLREGSAPLSRRREAMAVWPLAQAKIRAVLPIYRERIREMAIRGEERGIGYILLDIHIRPPLQEKRGGGSVTIDTSMNKRTPAILQREN
jgi:hypothetical protein